MSRIATVPGQKIGMVTLPPLPGKPKVFGLIIGTERVAPTLNDRLVEVVTVPSVTWKVSVNVPLDVGVQEIKPLAEFRLAFEQPVGHEPAIVLQV